jgi:hypothetical protein
MLGSNSNLSTFNGQQATAAKRKEDDATAVTQATAATVHREQEALVTAVATAHKTLYKARARERAATLTWEKEKTITRQLEQQLATAQGITISQDDDDDRSIDAGSNPDAALTMHLHAQEADL